MKKALMILCLAVVLAAPVLAATTATQNFPIMGQIVNSNYTVVVTTTDVSTLLTTSLAAKFSSIDTANVKAVLITCETNAARIAFGVAASTTVGHVIAAGSSLRLPSNSMFLAARIISASAGSAATLQVTLEY